MQSMFVAETYSASLSTGEESGWCVKRGDDTVIDFPIRNRQTDAVAKGNAETAAAYLNEVGLTALETDLIFDLVAESSANGHDFGLVECLSWKDKQQLGGLLTSLQSKGVVTYIEKTDVNGDDEVTQFGLHDRLTGRNEIPGGEL